MVTGASSGIGAASARRLGTEAFQIVIGAPQAAPPVHVTIDEIVLELVDRAATRQGRGSRAASSPPSISSATIEGAP